MMQFHHLHIIVPQGTSDMPKKEFLFQQVLINLQNTKCNERISLEFFGREQYTYCYLAVPDFLLETIEGLIYSTFPDAEIKETKDYTALFDFSNQAIAGTELTLKYFDLYPFKTFDAFTEDSQANLFSIISKITSGEQIWVQMVIQPRKKTAWFHFKRGILMRFASIRQAFHVKDWFRLKTEESIKAKRKARALDKYAEKPFDLAIRCAYIAHDSEIAKRKLHAVINSFYQFNDSDIQEFNASRIKTSSSFVQQYQRRELTNSFTAGYKEISTLYHFPNADHTPHIVHVLAKKSEPPQDLPRKGMQNVSFFGKTNYHNHNVEFGIRREDRRRHLYTVGKSGSGKSKLLELLIREDFESGQGVSVLDPHGDLVDAVMSYIPEHRINDVVLFDPSDTDFPISFNPLENVGEAYKMQITIGFIDIFKKLFGTNWSDRLEHVLRYTTLALLDSKNTTVLSILKMLTDKNYRQKIVSRIQDSVVKNFWVSEFAGWSEKFDAEAITPLLNKVGQLVSTNMIRNIIGQPKSKFNIRDIMDNRKILLMKISKGLLGEENASIIGSMIITKLYQAAMQRADIKEDQRKDFYCYIDEFQNFATDTFAEILSEARKYRLNLTLAHQYMGQLLPVVQKTVFGNVGSLINFRVGADDAKILADEYAPIFKERDIINLGVREFYLKMSVNGEIRKAFSGKTLEVKKSVKDCSKEIIAQARARYCTPKKEVEKLLQKWDEAGEFEEGNKGAQEEVAFEAPLI